MVEGPTDAGLEACLT